MLITVVSTEAWEFLLMNNDLNVEKMEILRKLYYGSFSDLLLEYGGSVEDKILELHSDGYVDCFDGIWRLTPHGMLTLPEYNGDRNVDE